MRAITLMQPWATLMALGAKTIETRSWKTDYRGPVAIHAAKGFPPAAREIWWTEPYRSTLEAAGYSGPQQLPRGAVLAVVELIICSPTEMVAATVPFPESAFGDYAPGRWVWVTGERRLLPYPILWKGALGLWTLPDEVITRALAQEGGR